MTIEEIILELEKGGVILHHLPTFGKKSEYWLLIGDENTQILSDTFTILRKKGILTYAGHKDEDISIYELKK